MDERIGVDQFNGNAKRQSRVSGSADSFRRGERKDRAQSFPARKDQMAHSALQGFRRLRQKRKTCLDGVVYERNSFRHVRIDIHSLFLAPRLAGGLHSIDQLIAERILIIVFEKLVRLERLRPISIPVRDQDFDSFFRGLEGRRALS